MTHARIPSAAEMMRMPAGDRALRLRWLAQWHRERLAALTASGSSNGITRHRNSLRKVVTVAAQCGIEGVADA